MTTRRSLILPLFLATLAIGLLHLAWSYRSLPDMVASHFDSAGKANSWSSKDLFVAIMAAIYCLIAGLFLGVGIILRRMPAHLMNLPHRAYWLAAEREVSTRLTLARSMLYLGWGTLLLLLIIVHLSFRTNQTAERSMGLTPWAVLGLYVVFCLGWIGWLFYRFGRLPNRALTIESQ